MSSVQIARLAELALLNPPLGERPADDDWVAFLPMSAVDAKSVDARESESRLFTQVKKGYTPFMNGDVLVAKITPCFENGKVAQARLTRRCGFGSTEFHVVRADERYLDSRYLVHYLRLERVRLEGERRMTGSAGQRRVPEKFLSDLAIPVRPLPEQRRIATILDKADELRAKRRAALAQLDALAQSIFLDMFGSPEHFGWEMGTVAAVADQARASIRTGPFGSQLLHGEFTAEGVAVLGIDNAVTNSFRWEERRYISQAKYRQLRRYTVRPGDVLITIMGTCGRCAVVPDDIPTAINTKHLCCITLDRKKCLPEYLHSYFLQHPIAKRYLDQTAKGAIMDGLNMGIIKAMPIPLAPIVRQQEFKHALEQIDLIRRDGEQSLASLDALFASLQHRAFHGEL